MEIWKDIKNYEGLYQVSNKGNVRSLPHVVKSSVCRSGKRLSQGRLLKQFITSNGYYKGVHLCKNNAVKTIMVHRLVAEAFCENNSEHNCVDHIDGNSQNNCSDNLRWCSHKENCNNPHTKKKASIAKQGLFGVLSNRHKKVAQLDLKGNVIRVWDFVKQVEDAIGISRSSVSLCANGKLKTAGGYKWSYNFKVK